MLCRPMSLAPMSEPDLNIEKQVFRPLIVVAHPDDEVIGCGILLQRLKDVTVTFLTDGAPADRYFWEKFGSRTRYVELRAGETQCALSRLKYVRTTRLGVRDQELAFHLDVAFEWLREAVSEADPDSIITHAYEGGHPDHDCCSFLCSLVSHEFGIPVWEMPLYSRAGGKLVRQHLPQGASTTCLSASDKEARCKAEMVAAYASQSDFLQTFDLTTEKFSPQPRHDYSRPPHEGKLNYECWGWEITGGDLCAAFARLIEKNHMQRAKSA